MKYVSILLCLLASACAGTQQERQQNADQLFGKAKMTLIGLTGTVGVYNVLCTGTLKTSSVCAPHVSEIVNAGLAVTADALNGAERVFAAANSTDSQKLDAAKAAIAAVSELLALVTKYDVTRVAG